MKKKLLILTSLAVLLLPFALVFQPVGAATKDDVCAGFELTGGSCTPQQGQPTVDSTIALVINILSIVVGVAAVIMIIIGGLRYITSGGDSASVGGAKNAILYAIIGLVIVALAQVIVQFVLNKATKQPTP